MPCRHVRNGSSVIVYDGVARGVAKITGHSTGPQTTDETLKMARSSKAELSQVTALGSIFSHVFYFLFHLENGKMPEIRIVIFNLTHV